MIFLKACGCIVVTVESERRFHCLAIFGKNECRSKSLMEVCCRKWSYLDGLDVFKGLISYSG